MSTNEAVDSRGSESHGNTAVYIPFKTFQTSLDVFTEGLPPKLDRSAWPTLSSVVRGQVLGGYKFLGLVDKDGAVQQELHELVETKDTARGKEIVAELLTSCYPKIADLAEHNGTIQNLQDAMRELRVSGSTLEKAIRFWVDGAKYAGVRHPTSWEKIPRSINNARPRKPKGPDDNKGSGSGAGLKGGTGQGSTTTVTLPGARVTLSVEVTDFIQLAAATDAMTWFQEVLAKFKEKDTRS